MKTLYKVLAVIFGIATVVLAIIAIYKGNTDFALYACIPMLLAVTFFNLHNVQNKRDKFTK